MIFTICDILWYFSLLFLKRGKKKVISIKNQFHNPLISYNPQLKKQWLEDTTKDKVKLILCFKVNIFRKHAFWISLFLYTQPDACLCGEVIPMWIARVEGLLWRMTKRNAGWALWELRGKGIENWKFVQFQLNKQGNPSHRRWYLRWVLKNI